MEGEFMKRTPEKNVDEMRRLLRKSGWSNDGVFGTWAHSDQRDEYAVAAEGRGREKGIEEGRRQAASEVIHALGLAEKYPDVTEEREGWRQPMRDSFLGLSYPEPYTYTEIIPGADAFLEDIATVAKSRDVDDARKRLGLTGKK